jgi:hypothetical protein
MRCGRPQGYWQRLSDLRVQVSLLGPFSIKVGKRSAGPWYRPPAKRLCELVMVSPGLRIGREAARELLFANLEPGDIGKRFVKSTIVCPGRSFGPGQRRTQDVASRPSTHLVRGRCTCRH